MPADAGCSERLPLADAWAWLDARRSPAVPEAAPLAEAAGRVLAADLLHPADRPDRDIALSDGYAVAAEATVGAGPYSPLVLPARPCRAGEALPDLADAVLGREAGEPLGGMLEVSAPVARGAGVARCGEAARRGDVALPAGTLLGPAHLALAASLGATHLTVWRRPAVALLVAGPKPPCHEALAAALAALVARDGGLPGAHPADADLVLMAGRSGWGTDDDAAPTLAAAGGALDHHGIAIAPGGSAGLGRLGAAPLVLLPGDPAAALVAYELLAGRLLRRLAHRPADWPALLRRVRLSRRVASPIGTTDFVPLVLSGELAAPLALPPADGLAGLVRADGFLVVPAGREGYAAGDEVAAVVTAPFTPRNAP